MTNEEKIAQPVLVTGATGFIGSRVVHKLLQNNVVVKALVLPREAILTEWADRVVIIRGSISDSQAVEKAAAGAKTIIHLAAIVGDWGDEKKFWEFTVEGSRQIFEQALENKARVVLASSIVVYGDNPAPKKSATAKLSVPTAEPSRLRKNWVGITIRTKV